MTIKLLSSEQKQYVPEQKPFKVRGFNVFGEHELYTTVNKKCSIEVAFILKKRLFCTEMYCFCSPKIPLYDLKTPFLG